MRRAHLTESEIDRLVELAHAAGLAALCVKTDCDGEASFSVAGLGTFFEVLPLERALKDAARVTS